MFLKRLVSRERTEEGAGFLNIAITLAIVAITVAGSVYGYQRFFGSSDDGTSQQTTIIDQKDIARDAVEQSQQNPLEGHESELGLP